MYLTLARKRFSAPVFRRLLVALLVAGFAVFALIQPARFALRRAAAQVVKAAKTTKSTKPSKVRPLQPLDTGTGSISLTALGTAATENFDRDVHERRCAQLRHARHSHDGREEWQRRRRPHGPLHNHLVLEHPERRVLLHPLDRC